MGITPSIESNAVPRLTQSRWADMLRADALCMRYQPLLALRAG